MKILADECIVGMKKITWAIYEDSDDPAWEVGMLFKDHQECRDSIIKHSYKQDRQIHFTKSDKKRVRAVCKHPCPWYMYASLNFDKTFQMKQVGPGAYMMLYSNYLFIHFVVYLCIY